MYKVFINDSSIQLLSNKQNINQNILPFKGANQLLEIIARLEKSDEREDLIITHNNLNELWETFKQQYTLINAAGGVVKNSKGQLLMIYRLGKWDLPKGKLEDGESIEQCAKREVAEECGIAEPKIIKQLPTTYHTYSIKSQKILKSTYWYEMLSKDDSELIPQVEEDIEKAQWSNDRQVKENLKNTYSSIKWLLGQL